jgi:hypothetical protein
MAKREHPINQLQIDCGLASQRAERYRAQMKLADLRGQKYERWHWYGLAEVNEIMRVVLYRRIVRESAERAAARKARAFTKEFYSIPRRSRVGQ